MSDTYTSKYRGREIDSAVEKVNKSIPAQIADLQANKADRTELPKTVADLGFDENKYIVEIEESSASSDVAKRYIIKQGDIGLNVTIDIPKDMVVSSGTVETYTDDDKPEDVTEAGTYIVLTIANSAKDRLYIKANTLVEGLAPIAYVNEELAKKADKTLLDGKLDYKVSTDNHINKYYNSGLYYLNIEYENYDSVNPDEGGGFIPVSPVEDGSASDVVTPSVVNEIPTDPFYLYVSTEADDPEKPYGGGWQVTQHRVKNSILQRRHGDARLVIGKTYVTWGEWEDYLAGVDVNELLGEYQTKIERIKYYGDPDIIPSDESYFTVNETGETITGLTDAGKTQTELVIPYKINGVEITSLCSNIEGISILDGNTVIKKVVIPNSVTSIGEFAFINCNSLENVKISDSVKSIGTAAFYNCTLLTSINIPNSITNIDYSVFEGCTSLKSINIPSSVTSIGVNVFGNCTSLTSVNIPNNVTSIDGMAFYNCTNLTIYCEQGSYADTYAKENNFPVVYTDIKATTLDNKADKATTLEGYGITDAYTKDEVDSKISSVYTFAGSRTAESLSSFNMSDLPATAAPINVYNISIGGVLEGITRTNLSIMIQCITVSPGEAYFRLADYEKDSAKLAVGDTVSLMGIDYPELTITSISAIDYYASYSGDYDFGTSARTITIYKAKGAQITVSAGDNIALSPAGWDKLASTVDLTGYQTKLTFDTTPTDGSDNPVTSGGVANAINTLSDRIEAVDDNATMNIQKVSNDVSDVSGRVTSLEGDMSNAKININDNLSDIQEIKNVTIPELSDKIENKQDKLTFDTTPTDGSENPVTSDGIYDAFSEIQTGMTNIANYAAENRSEIGDITARVTENESKIGDIDTALDSIIAIQNGLMGVSE